jgi:hypothetical protein
MTTYESTLDACMHSTSNFQSTCFCIVEFAKIFLLMLMCIDLHPPHTCCTSMLARPEHTGWTWDHGFYSCTTQIVIVLNRNCIPFMALKILASFVVRLPECILKGLDLGN